MLALVFALIVVHFGLVPIKYYNDNKSFNFSHIAKNDWLNCLVGKKVLMTRVVCVFS